MTKNGKNQLDVLAIGDKVRQIRMSKGIAIPELAEKTGLPKSVISQIETSQVSPPIATLLKIANGLGTDIGLFFQETTDSPKTIVTKKDQRKSAPRRKFKGAQVKLGYNYEALAYQKAFKHMEPFLVTFESKPKDQVVMFSHEGEEFAFILSGEIEFCTEKATYTLEPGDSLYFDSDQLHGFRALGDTPAQALVVVYHS